MINYGAWHRPISRKLIQIWTSFPKISLAHAPILYRNWIGTHNKLMDKFSRNCSSSCPGNWKFGKISGWVFQDLPIRDKSARSKQQFENQNKLRGCKQRQRVMKKVDPKCVSNGWLKAIKGTIVNWPPWWVAPKRLFRACFLGEHTLHSLKKMTSPKWTTISSNKLMTLLWRHYLWVINNDSSNR